MLAKSQKMDQSTEKLAKTFLTGKDNNENAIATFLEEYLTSRAAYHALMLKIESTKKS